MYLLVLADIIAGIDAVVDAAVVVVDVEVVDFAGYAVIVVIVVVIIVIAAVVVFYTIIVIAIVVVVVVGVVVVINWIL